MPPDPPPRTDLDPRILQILAVLEKEPSHRTAALAALVDLTPGRLQHLFSKEVGISVTAYALELRLERARHLLVTTWQSIKEVRCAAGIPNGPNFVRHFRRRFQRTPSAYREAFHSRIDEQIAELTNTAPLQKTGRIAFTATANETERS